MAKKQRLSYLGYGDMMTTLVEKLKDSDKEFDLIYGVPRGGLPIAVHLSYHLEIPLITELNVNNFVKRNILVVDNLTDSGQTLVRICKDPTFENHSYTVVTLFYKPWSAVKPDYYVEDTIHHIVFPWEAE